MINIKLFFLFSLGLLGGLINALSYVKMGSLSQQGGGEADT